MYKKLSLRKMSIFIVGAVVFLSLTLFLYRWTFNNTVIVQRGSKQRSVDDKTAAPKISTPRSEQALQKLLTDPKQETLQTSESPPNTKEVEEAISFFKGLQQTSTGKTNTNPKGIQTERNLSQDEMFQLVHEGISYYDSLVESASVNFSLEITSVDYPGITRASSGTWEGVFEFSGSQIRGNVTQNATQYGGEHGDIQLSGVQQFAYNGETFETLRETPNEPLLTRGNNMRYNKSHDPRFWGWNLSGDEPLVGLIDSLDIQDIQQVDWNGSQVYHVKGFMQEGMVDVDLWLNPEKSYRPDRFVYSIQNEGGTQVQVTKDFNFQEVAPDLWFPESAQSVTTVINDDTGEAISIETATMSLSDVRINEHIPLSRFSIDPPDGTTVFDMRNGESFKKEKEEE